MVVTAVLVAQYAGTFDVADTTRFSLRASQPPPYADAHVNGKTVPGEILIAADASTSASARMSLRMRRWVCSFGVTGSLSATDLEEGLQLPPLVTVGANASQGWRERMVSLTLSESGSYGLVSAAIPYQQTPAASTMMPTQPGMPVQPTMPGQPGPTQGQPPTQGATTLLSQQGTLTTGAFDGSGSLSWRGWRRTAFGVQGGYSISGGMDATSRQVLPRQDTPHGGINVSTPLSRHDTLSLSLSGSDTITTGLCTLVAPTAPGVECREEVPGAALNAAFRHGISRTGTVSVTGGVAATVAATPGLNELVIIPVGAVSLGDTIGRSSYAFAATFAPSVDIRTGLPSNRLVLSANLVDRVVPRANLNFGAVMTQSVPFPAEDPFPITAFSGSLEVRFLADRRAVLGVGLQGSLQHQSLAGPNSAAPGGPEWNATEIAFVSVTANTRTLHF
jgi:hypothetical protein